MNSGKKEDGVKKDTIILPCPFCGTAAHVGYWHGGTRRKTMVSCDNEQCAAAPMLTAPSRAKAIQTWNTRAPVEELRDTYIVARGCEPGKGRKGSALCPAGPDKKTFRLTPGTRESKAALETLEGKLATLPESLLQSGARILRRASR